LLALGVWFLLTGGRFGRRIRHVVLISMDTTRADYLSCYGCLYKTTPNIDAVAKEGVLFKNVVSSVPLTLPSHSTMMTGTYPTYHGVHDNLDYRLGQSNVTLAETLKENGFKTAGIISTYVLDSQFALDQGFDYYDDNFEKKHMVGELNERKGDETTKVAIKWLDENKDEKFFLFLHYYDPHSPYDPPEPFLSRFIGSRYAGEIAFTDHCIGRVIDKLKGLGIYDSTLIIITGDHGEMLGEHKEAAHAYFIYQSAIKVPLIFKLPGKSRPKRISGLVGLVDIVPTICSLLGIEPQTQMQGDDLSPYLRKKNPPNQDKYVYCESLLCTKYDCSPLLGVVNNRFKYIQTTRPELYDLNEDPHEKNNLIEKQSNRARIMKDRLEQILEETVRKDSSESKMELDEESVRRLESLGYVAGDGVSEDFEFDQTKDDPKDWIDFHNKNSRVAELIMLEKYDEAEKLSEQLIEIKPDFFVVYLHLFKIHIKQKDIDGAIAHLLEARRIAPERFEVHNALGLAMIQKGDLDEAVQSFEEALQLRPHRYSIRNNLAETFLKQGEYDKALEQFNKSIEIEPLQDKVYHHIGLIMAEKENYEESIKYYHKAIELGQDHVDLFNNLSAALIKLERFDEALEIYAKSLELKNEQPVVHKIIGDIYHNRFTSSRASFGRPLSTGKMP